jgi:hypothetical protein
VTIIFNSSNFSGALVDTRLAFTPMAGNVYTLSFAIDNPAGADANDVIGFASDNAAQWTNTAVVGTWTNVAATSLSFSAAGLTPGRPYYFTFRATNALDSLWATNVQSFTTLAPPVPPVPVLPVSGVKATNGVPSFTFTAAAGVKYRLDYKNALPDAWIYDLPWTTNSTGSNVLMTLTDLTATDQPQRLYRLEAANP